METDIRKRLRKFSDDLKKIYDEIYNKVIKKEYVKILFDYIYILIMYIYTLLTNIELIIIINLDFNKDIFYLINEIDERFILDLDNNLFVFNS